MMKFSTIWRYAMVTSSLLVCGPVLADNCSGYYSQVVTELQSLDLGGGHKLAMFITKSTDGSTDSPFTGTGQCTGYALTTPDGKTRMAGVCGRKSKDGSWSDTWALEPGADRGTGKLAGGTGAFAGKSGSGWWQDITSENGVTVGKWGGNCN